MNITIEKGIPVSPSAHHGKPKSLVVAAFGEMEVGDSFLIPEEVRINTARSTILEGGPERYRQEKGLTVSVHKSKPEAGRR